MKRFLLALCISMSFMLFTAAAAVAEEADEKQSLNLAPNAKSAILMERDTGTIIYDKNAHEILPPASMTKLMTMLIIMEEMEKGNLKKDEIIRVSENAASMCGSQIFLEAGEEMTVEELLKGVAIASANDASVALAERISGSEEAFVAEMNKKAKELGLKNTKFQNTSGLPAKDHYSTAYDMAIIAKELLKYETITEYTSIYEDYLRKGKENEFWLVNTNKLVRFYPGVDGLKTGYTQEAKYCLTATAKKDDMRVIAVVMGADTSKERNAMISSMLDYAFQQYETNKLYDKGEVITELNLLKADKRNVPIVLSESVSTLHKKGENKDNIRTEIQFNEEIKLPIEKGAQVGTLLVKDGKETLMEVPLTVDQTVKEASYYKLLQRTIAEIAKH
jgi:D-alanyl-D-alanine carboxypeptidase (penicillin-binding protein 5/6)